MYIYSIFLNLSKAIFQNLIHINILDLSTMVSTTFFISKDTILNLELPHFINIFLLVCCIDISYMIYIKIKLISKHRKKKKKLSANITNKCPLLDI